MSNTRYDYDKLMKQLEGYETLEQNEDGSWSALLKNHHNPPACFYDSSHGDLYIRVKLSYPEEAGNYNVMLSVHSIDDGAIVLIGPVESKEKAEHRLTLLKAEAESWAGWIPTEEQVIAATKKTGCWWNR